MAIFTVKCPSCGSATELNDEKESGFCTECGMKIITAEAELFVPDEDSVPADAEAPAADLPVPAAEDACDAAPDAEPALPADAEAPAFVEAGPPLNNAEQLEYLLAHKPEPLDSVTFRNSDECAAYANGLHALILDLSARYARMNHAEEATCLDFLERGIDYCEYLDTRKLKFLAGTHEEKGKTVEDYGTYPVSKSLLREIKDVREQFVEAYNGFFTPKIAAGRAALEETKEKIRQLDGKMRFFHSFCRPLMGVLTLALFAVGLVPILMKLEKLDLRVNIPIAVVGGALFIFWAVTSVFWLLKGGSARQLYKTAERQTGEVRTYRGKLKS